MPEIERRRKKPLPIEVLLWDGTNYRQIDGFAGEKARRERNAMLAGGELSVWNDQDYAWLDIPLGHYVAKGALGEFYPLSPEAYQETTEPGGAADRPRIVCLCGSTRFYAEFRRANLRLTMEGQIVLSIGCDTKSDDDLAAASDLGSDLAALKTRLDDLHKRKIDLADYVLVLNVGGYIGDSTRSEIAYAYAHGKPVSYLAQPPDIAAPGESAGQAEAPHVDVLVKDAGKFAAEHAGGYVTAGMVQRRLYVGYARARILLDALASAGTVTGPDGKGRYAVPHAPATPGK